jgi:hypothetical protein
MDRRALLVALGRFVLAFALLACPWPGLGRAYADVVGSLATAAADPFFQSGNVTFVLRAPTPDEQVPDWRGVIQVKQDLPEGPVRQKGAIDLRRAGYLQLVTFLCLAVAWPAAWRDRKLLAAGVALLVVGTVTGVSIVDYLVQVGAVDAGHWGSTLLALARRALVGAPGMAYAVPALAWIAVGDHDFLKNRPSRPALLPVS